MTHSAGDHQKEGEMSTITKNDLVRKVTRCTGCKKTLAKQAVDSFFGAMRDALIEGNRIEIRGLGAWSVKWMNPKPDARNPRTGESISVPARRKVYFKPGRVLKNALDEPIEEGWSE